MLSFISASAFRVTPTAVYQRAALAANPAQRFDSFQRSHSNAISSPSSQWQSYLTTANAHFGQKMKKGRQDQQRAEEERLNALAQAYYAYHNGDDTQKKVVEGIAHTDLGEVLKRAEQLGQAEKTLSVRKQTVPGTGKTSKSSVFYRHRLT